jgi:RNA 3'-terminal phosphate cyclase
VTAFAEQVALGALTSQFVFERRRLEARTEHLRMQHTEAVRDKWAAENKSRNRLEKLSVVEKEREDLDHWLAEEKEDAEKARAEAQVARVEAQAARAEAETARKRAADMELESRNICSHREKTESSTRAGIERAHTHFVYAYRELGVQTAPFDELGEEVGLRFLRWLQVELESLPSIATDLMSYASLVTCEGAVNALSREGCRHFEVFDRANENFDHGVF